MICKDTIEEKFVSDIISTDNDVVKILSKDNVSELFG
jgi:hypothetical protein